MPLSDDLDNCYEIKHLALLILSNYSPNQPDLEKLQNLLSQNFEIKEINMNTMYRVG